jgi:hypothetical protein
VAQLQSRLKQTGTWKDTYQSSTGSMLIDFLAYTANLNNYYIERRAQEGYIGTARNRSSLINISKLLNYNPAREISARGTLTFSIALALTANVYIPVFTECQTGDGLKFVTFEDAVIIAGQTSVTVEARQGSLVSKNVVSSGVENLEVLIESIQVENDALYVYINDILWNKVTSFLNSQAASTDYRVRTENNDYVTINFGNGITGKIPPANSTITIKYIASDGVDGNVYETDKVNKVNGNIFDENGVIREVSVTNDNLLLGGENKEADEEIRNNAPQVFQAGDRLVTKRDYRALIGAYPGVANVNAWGEREESAPNYDMFNKIRISIILQNWALPDVMYKQTLAEYLYDYAELTVKYEFVDPTVIYTVPTLTVKVAQGYSLSEVQGAIENALQVIYTLGTTTTIGVSKRFSNIVETIEAVTGVAHHYLSNELRQDLSDSYDSSYDWGGTLELLTVLPESVKIYDGTDTLLATDDGIGSFVSESDYGLTGSINYTTGEILVDVAAVTGVYARYNQNENGDLIVSKNQILKLYEVDVLSIGYVTV